MILQNTSGDNWGNSWGMWMPVDDEWETSGTRRLSEFKVRVCTVWREASFKNIHSQEVFSCEDHLYLQLVDAKKQDREWLYLSGGLTAPSMRKRLVQATSIWLLVVSTPIAWLSRYAYLWLSVCLIYLTVLSIITLQIYVHRPYVPTVSISLGQSLFSLHCLDKSLPPFSLQIPLYPAWHL